MTTENAVLPGRLIEDQWLPKNQITKAELSRQLGVSESLVSRLMKGQRHITPSLARGLARIFGNDHHYWLDLQSSFDGYVFEKDTSSSVLEKSNVHPGVILETEWMSKANINKSELSRRLEVSETMGSYITKGTRDISIDLAHKLAKIFNNHYHYWIDLQIAYDEGNNA